MSGELQLILAMVAIVAAGASIAYWRLAVFAALVLVVFEGALRKWGLPGAQAALYLAKDVLLLGAYVGFAMAKGVKPPVPQARPYIVLLLMAAGYGALEMLNPAMPSFALAAVGWRSYFFYVPLLFIVPHLFSSHDHLARTLERFALLALPVAALGVVQFYSPMDSVLNTNVQHEEGGGAALGFGSGDRVRVAGTFAFVTGYAVYLLTVSLLVGALLAAKGWGLRGNALLYVTLILVIAAMFATGSRGPVFSLIAVAVFYSIFAAASGDLSVGAAVRACLGAALLAIAVWQFLPEPAEAFQQRALGADDTFDRLVNPFVEPFRILEEAGIAGYGIGAAHQSAAFLLDSQYSWWTNGLVAEAESSKVMLEMGILGFVLVYLFRIVIAFAALRAAFVLKTRTARTFALVIALFLGLQVTSSVIFNPTMNVFYWFAVGMLFTLLRLEALVAWRARNPWTRGDAGIPGRDGGGRFRNA